MDDVMFSFHVEQARRAINENAATSKKYDLSEDVEMMVRRTQGHTGSGRSSNQGEQVIYPSQKESS